MKKTVGAAALLGITAILAQGCSSPPGDDVGSSEGAAVVNVSNAKVALCGEEDDGKGCLECPPLQIPDNPVDPGRVADACTLKVLRDPLKKRVMVLIAEAGRRGLFLRSGGGDDAPVRLTRISVVSEIGGARNAVSQQTRLSGSFTLGEEPNASSAKGGVTVYSVFMPVKFVFEFEDKTGSTLRQEPFAMRNTYNLIPFFYMKGQVGVSLNLGGILSKFGAGPVSSALLAALGGEASLQVDAEQERTWTTPACADGDLTSDKSDKSQAFDNDFLENVLVPMCKQYKADNGVEINCSLESMSSAPLADRFDNMTRKRILPLEACTSIEAPFFGPNTYKVSFVAPEKWGFRSGQEVFAYERNANAADIWKRKSNMVVVGADRQKCGARGLKQDEVCVHATLQEAWFGGACAKIGKAGGYPYGVAQDNADETGATIQYAITD